MSTKPSPFVIHPHLHPRRTGVTRHVETVVPALVETTGLEVVTWGRSLDPRLPKLSFAQLWRRLRAGPVVWHAHRNNELLVGLLLRMFARSLRLVFTRHSSTRPGAYTRWLARRAERVLALNEDAAGHFAPRAQVVEHGVALSRFMPPPGRDPARPTLGVVGRVRPEKGQGDLAEALSPLLPQFPAWRVRVVGRVAPEHRAFAEGLRAALGDRLSLEPERPDVEAVYRALDVVVQPSHTEGFSLVLLEAMASGCCVIASALPYAKVALRHGQTGFLYPPGDVDALRQVLAEVLCAPERAAAVGRAAAASVRERFGLEHEARKLAAVYREVSA